MKKKIGTALVVGAGISGIRAALDLAEFGYGVTLIDRAPHIGGILSKLDYQFPTNHCGMCKMLPLVQRDSSSQFCLRKGFFHENIDILLSTELRSIQGEPGHFQVSLREKNSWIDPELCTGCGECAKVCPVQVPDSFNANLTSRKAVYLPVPHTIPNPYIIDVLACNRCGECEKVCPTGAIRLSKQERKEFHILIVDDELSVRDSLKESLSEEDFSVDIAGSGKEALDKLENQKFHLMLTDIKMPEMDGVQLLKIAKEKYPDLSVAMMTAYATVETAVQAMKTGAFDYVMKPFEFEKLMNVVFKVYEDFEARKERKLEVGAVVLCGGTAYYDPEQGKNTFGYGKYPNVVTSIEFERIFSGTGPNQGRLIRLDGKPVKKTAWLQCVGSRDIQENADFCSSICCMYAIKEALIAKEKTCGQMETAIFYMDMRTFGKSFQRYRDDAEKNHKVRFQRGKVHSVAPDDKTGDLIIRAINQDGTIHEENFDMVVLAVGQRPSSGTENLSEMLEIPLNNWGFIETVPFYSTRTARDGIFSGGSFSGLKDISESVIQASSSALSASHVIHSAGGSLTPEPKKDFNFRDVSRETAKVLIIICTCGKNLSEFINTDQLAKRIKIDPSIEDVLFLEKTCTARGWESLLETAKNKTYNRLLIGSCLPYVYARKFKELSSHINLDPHLIDVIDIFTPTFSVNDKKQAGAQIESNILIGLAKIKHADSSPVLYVDIIQKALVIGGGIAGMTSALSIANHGFKVDLVEREENLGGNVCWIQNTIENNSPQTLLKETIQKVEKHQMIQVHTSNIVISSSGQVGEFYTRIKDKDKNVHALEHGITILATGGTEASTTSYSYGINEKIVTQKELEQKLSDNLIDPKKLNSVVMIQCVDSRQEPRNYCSRICCTSSLKHALNLKEQNPDISIYILYRDIMTFGFAETYYTKARKAGIIFIPYNVEQKPKLILNDNSLQVKIFEPIIGKEVEISADFVVLATGIIPDLTKDLAQSFGASLNQDGFFQEAESKFRPVDSLKEGVFACGISHSPGSITESIATAQAAAQRALRILCKKKLASGKITAKVRHSLCALCGRCIDACPYGARILDLDLEKVLINPVMCQGCGSCAAICPNSASEVVGFEQKQMFEVIEAGLV